MKRIYSENRRDHKEIKQKALLYEYFLFVLRAFCDELFKRLIALRRENRVRVEGKYEHEL